MDTQALPPDAADAPAPSGALAAALQHIRHRALRTLVFVSLLCLGIALLNTAIAGRGFGVKLLYSFCIGAACLMLVEGGRLAAAAASDAWRRWRGLAPSALGFGSGWRGALMVAPLAALGGPLLGLSLADALSGYRSPSLLHLDSTSTRLTLVLALLGTAVSVFVLGTMERLASARAQAEAAQRAAAENQLRLLQSQLEPHMLFNTLANLRVLITLDPPRAQAMLDHLIAFLRATLGASRRTLHPLADEFRHLDDYLALMAVRMGPRLRLHLDLPAELAALPVPPLLLQPLVENAIKHGLEPQVAGGRIEVGARREGGLLRLWVRDTGLGLPADGFARPLASADGGFGLEQVRARLATLHGGRASLRLQPADDGEGGVIATVLLPLDAGTGATGTHRKVETAA